MIEKQLIANVLRGMYSVKFNGGASSQETSTQVQSAPHRVFWLERIESHRTQQHRQGLGIISLGCIAY